MNFPCQVKGCKNKRQSCNRGHHALCRMHRYRKQTNMLNWDTPNPMRELHKMYHTIEYKTFTWAKARCNNPNVDRYCNYGGRGIKFLFTSFKEFYAELGKRPEGMSLDRIDVNGNYEAGNVRWAGKFT